MNEEANEMNLINELKMLAEDLHANDNHKHAVAMRLAADELGKWEAVFGHLGGTPDECGNAIIAARDELLDRLEASEQEVIEEARLNGMGSEREASLMARLEAAEKERDALRAQIERMEQQTPVAWAATDETCRIVEALGFNQSRRFDTPLYLTPGAKGETK